MPIYEPIYNKNATLLKEDILALLSKRELSYLIKKVLVTLEIDISGFGQLKLEYLVCDFNGTLALDGKLLPNIKPKLTSIAEFLKIVVLTSDEFGKAKEELKEVNCSLHILEEKNMDTQKAEFVTNLGSERVVAFGNGVNDRKMLKVAKLGVVIVGSEGCATETLLAADIQVASIVDGFDLLLNPRRLRATLKF